MSSKLSQTRERTGLDAGPAACGYEDQCWTLARITDQAWQRFGAEYTLGGVHVLLYRIGWSVQVPARRAAERDEAAVAAWREEPWPVIKGRLRNRAPGWSSRTSPGRGLRPPKGRTCGRRGRTPVVTVTGGSSKRVSLAALIAVKDGQRPRLLYRVHSGRRGDTSPKSGHSDTRHGRSTFLGSPSLQV